MSTISNEPLTLKPDMAAGLSSMFMLLGSMMSPRLCRLHTCGSWRVGVGTFSTATVQSMLDAVTVAVAGSVSGILASASDASPILVEFRILKFSFKMLIQQF